MALLRYVLVCVVLIFASKTVECKSKGGFYSYKVKDIHNQITSLEQYRGKISLVVNVASECGYTDEHYKQLTALHKELAEENKEPFTVLAFPCNQFGNQEPYDNDAIHRFATETYGSSFPMFAKVEVREIEADPVYQYIKRNHGTEPEWNFWKYLINEDGKVIGGWGPRTTVDDVKPDILEALKELKSKKHNEL